jgi:hypothetical protein
VENALAAGAGVAGPDVVARIARRGAEEVEALDDLFERVPVRKAGAADADVLLEAEVLDLVEDGLAVVLAG